MTQVAEVANALPVWTGQDGLPLSWRHFVIGVRFINRDTVTRTIDMAAAARAGGASQEDYVGWRDNLLDKV